MQNLYIVRCVYKYVMPRYKRRTTFSKIVYIFCRGVVVVEGIVGVGGGGGGLEW